MWGFGDGEAQCDLAMQDCSPQGKFHPGLDKNRAGRSREVFLH